jgi:hypothetical protein
MKQKGLLLIVILILISVNAYAEGIEIAKGTLKMGIILQSTFSYSQSDEAINTSFNMKRARFLFYGTILPDKIKYFVQFEGVSSPYLLDTKLQFFYIPKTEITFGRFLPNFTYYMPILTSKLDMINYPLMTMKYGMWRQVGIQSTTTTKFIDFNLGIFNGYPSNNWQDNNDAKDVLFRTTIKPLKELQIFAYSWFGNSLFAKDADLPNNIYGIGFSSEKIFSSYNLQFVLRSELILSYENITKDNKMNGKGYYIHTSIKFPKNIEVLFRYDFYTPNTKLSHNNEKWYTVGLNYYILNNNAMLYLNYIHKKDEISQLSGARKSNEYILQAQISF